MFCTSCGVEIEDENHYKTKLHSINTKRKCKGLSPFTQEDLESESYSDSYNLSSCYVENSEIEEDFVKIALVNARKTKNICNKSTCMFCDEEETPEHYEKKHFLTYDQICYVYSNVCWVCKEGFGYRECLKLHLLNNKHKNIFTDGTSLFLENGKILHPDKQKLYKKR